MAIMFGLAFTAVMAFPSAFAQTVGKPDTMFVAAIPMIVGLGVGVVYWAAISARRSGR
jgi:hypothetical protein